MCELKRLIPAYSNLASLDDFQNAVETLVNLEHISAGTISMTDRVLSNLDNILSSY